MEKRESLTALLVAAARGLGRGGAKSDRDGALPVLDPFARRLLPRAVGSAVGALGSFATTDAGNAAFRALTGGLVHHIELRTLAIDAALLRFLSRTEHAQVVLLGAGADARAYRLPELAGKPLYEVDHPSTQAEKRARAAGLTPHATLTYVPVDFEKDSLARSLDAAGFDRLRPAFVIWEGVTMYLTPAAAKATLAVLRDLLAVGSALAVTYAMPELSPVPRQTRPLIRAVFSLIGEPLLGLYSPAEMAGLLATAGFYPREDTGPLEWAGAHDRPPPVLPVYERLAIATRP